MSLPELVHVPFGGPGTPTDYNQASLVLLELLDHANVYFTAVGLGYLLPFCCLCCRTYGHAITSAGDEEPGVQQPKGDEAGPSSSLQGSQGLQLGTVESHWQTETDYYAATVALDFLSFAFVALFYQVIQMLATCPALPCPSLPCPALPCPVLSCPALTCPALPYTIQPCPISTSFRVIKH